ncbi:MAG: DUF1080 domain-containing protein [Cyclobacteriaceae bacterium]|jgi:hypothetical protein
MKKLTLTAMAVLLAIGSYAQKTSDENWIQLFNGKDLNDWHVKINGYELDDNFGNTFYVEDGVMKVKYDEYDKFDERFGHIFYKKPFSYYKIAVEYRFIGEQAPEGPAWAYRNSGIMVHGQPPHTMEKDQNFPISIEVQLLGGDGENKRPTANVCTPGTEIKMKGEMVKDHCVNSNSKTYHGDQWVRMEVVVMGDNFISHIMEGEEVIYYTAPEIGGGTVSNFNPAIKKDGKPLTGGYISLQSESHPIEFRKVELLELEGCMDPNAKNYKTYYVKSNKSRCVYD